jgi:hypothetical protein
MKLSYLVCFQADRVSGPVGAILRRWCADETGAIGILGQGVKAAPDG